ncbi:uncharacterized protein LOC113228198 [Hyposmocoma kahamanoa]|uniref:uncharacterized protein LOC113228198 n=1 Tax=Hyposmocoma kahamanoa TaxID=1477025 RepID=UPI000E6D5AF8|nr:uncharacterized protein LOC113228198 [Hyposmocoma kahamanoa]
MKTMDRAEEELKCLFGCKFYSAYLHMFPDPAKERKLFAQWLQETQHIIKETEPDIIYKKYRVCHEHFASHMKYGQFISRTAVPSLNLKDKNTNKRKRKEPVTNVVKPQDNNLAAAQAEDNVSKTASTQDDVLEEPVRYNNYAAISCSLNADHDYTMMYDDQNNDELFKVDEKAEEEKRSEAYHEGYSCNVCEGIIKGYRYTCVQCRDFDLCHRCEEKGLHSLHYVLRIPKPRANDDVENLLSIIRRELFGENTASRNTTPKDQFDPILDMCVNVDSVEEVLFVDPKASDKPSIANQLQHKVDEIHVETNNDIRPETYKKAIATQFYSNNRKKTLPNIIEKRNAFLQQKENDKIRIANVSLYRKFSENLSFLPLSDPITAGGDDGVIFCDSGQSEKGAVRQNGNVNLHSAQKFAPRWLPKREVISKESSQAKARPKIIICKSKLVRKAKLKKGNEKIFSVL